MVARSAILSVLIGCLPLAHAQSGYVLNAAKKFLPAVEWKQESIVSLDFTCRGKRDFAIFGVAESEDVQSKVRTNPKESASAVVAVFSSGLRRKPQVFRSSVTNTEFSRLTIEDNDLTTEDFKGIIGEVPEGYVFSKTCKSLNLADGERDALHIYWNKKRKIIGVWRL